MKKNKIQILLVSLVLIGITLFFIVSPNILLAKKITPFAIHWMILCFLAGLLFLVLNHNFLLYVSIGCTSVLALLLMSSYNTDLKLAVHSTGGNLSIVFINPTLSSDGEEKLLDRLILQNPDIIIMEEMTPNWIGPLQQESGRYPFQVLLPSIDPLGKAILSKFALSNQDTFTLCDVPVLSVSLLSENLEKIVLTSSNYIPPITMSAYKKLNCFLDSLSMHLRAIGNHSIVAANFNVTPWSKELRDFRSRAHLVSSRRDNYEGLANSNVFGIFNAPNNEIYFNPTLECSLFTVIKDSKDNPIGLFGKYQFKN